MKPIQYYTAEILEDVCGRLRSISKNVFPERRPKASPRQMDDLIVIDLPYGFRDENVLQTGLLRVEFIVRDKENGIVNVEKLQSMLDAFTAMLPFATERFRVHTPKLALKGEDGAGFTIWCVHANVVVYTIDRFVIGKTDDESQEQS